MCSLLAVPSAVFSLDYAGQEVSVPQPELLALDLRELRPIRRFAAYQGQKRNPGLFWSVTKAGFVGYESRLEAQHLLAADFDPGVSWIVEQPFRVHFGGEGLPASHVPDFLLLGDGEVPEVLNVATPRRAAMPDIASRLAAMSRVCSELGWRHRVAIGGLAPARLLNLQFLAAARLEPPMTRELAPSLQAACVGGVRWDEAERRTGEVSAIARPILAHLIWHRQLVAELDRPISSHTILEARRGD